MPLARRTTSNEADPASAAASAEAREMSDAVVRALHHPLEALRACLEALTEELTPADPRGAFAASAEEEVERLVRRGRLLTEYLSPPRPRPLRCSLGEIAYDARRSLPAGMQGRTWVALDSGDHELLVDGPLLSKALAYLIENGFEAGSERVLVHGRRDGDAFELAVVDRGAGTALELGQATRPFHSTKHGQLGLGLTVAARDVEALGGTLRLEQSAEGDTCFRIRVPVTPPGGGPR